MTAKCYSRRQESAVVLRGAQSGLTYNLDISCRLVQFVGIRVSLFVGLFDSEYVVVIGGEAPCRQV
jgi:hypothetical protein